MDQVQIGGELYRLRKRNNEVRVVSESAARFSDHLMGDGLSAEVTKLGGGLWNVAFADPEKLERIISSLRTVTVAHHSYELDLPDVGVPFVFSDLIHVRFTGNMETEAGRIQAEHALERFSGSTGDIVTYRLTNRTGMNPLKLVAKLSADPGVLWAEPDLRRNQVRLCPPDPSFLNEQWHLIGKTAAANTFEDCGILAPEAWKVTTGNEEIVIAIIDDGFDLNNPDLKSNIVEPADFADVLPGVQGEVVPRDHEPWPEYEPGDYHGTPCAGLAIARGVSAVSGVAPGCSWMPVRFQFGEYRSEYVMMKIFEFVSQRADIVSCSWGADHSGFSAPSQLMLDTFARLTSTGGRRGRGLVACFAAGNSNLPTYLPGEKNPDGMAYYSPEGRLLGHFFKNKTIRGAWTELPDIVVVGSVTSRGRKSMYSNWGPHLTVVAPSDNFHPRGISSGAIYDDAALVTTDNENVGRDLHDVGIDKEDLGFVTRCMGGTSGATPQAAGVLGLILSVRPDLDATSAIQVLRQSADRNLDPVLDEWHENNQRFPGDFSTEGHSFWFGYGKINALAAVRAAIGQV